MRDLLFIVWIATLGVTRLDLTGGAVDFLVTPFLVLSPIIILLEAGITAGRGGAFRMPANATGYFLSVSALILVVLLSTFLSVEPQTAARRFVLLALQVYMVLGVMVALANRPDPWQLVMRGAYAGLSLCLLFNLVQIYVWFGGNPLSGIAAGVLELEVRNYAGIIPRLSGVSLDPSLGGMLILTYLFLVVRLGRASPLRALLISLAVASLLLTISRSVILAGMVTLGAAVVLQGRLRVTPRMMGAAAAGGTVVVLLLILFPATLERALAIADLLGNRLLLSEGSSSEHATVMARAWEVGTANVKQLLMGIGYGNAYLALQDLYPGDRYGNFHSLYMTLFAESGIFALVIVLGLFLFPLLRESPWRALVMGMIVFNIFQQNQTDPTLWVVLSLGWLGIGAPTGGGSEPGARPGNTAPDRAPQELAHAT
jgi:hypothetical protein